MSAQKDVQYAKQIQNCSNGTDSGWHCGAPLWHTPRTTPRNIPTSHTLCKNVLNCSARYHCRAAPSAFARLGRQGSNAWVATRVAVTSRGCDRAKRDSSKRQANALICKLLSLYTPSSGVQTVPKRPARPTWTLRSTCPAPRP